MNDPKKLSFDDTEVAFRHRNAKELRKAHWMFSVISHPRVVALGSSLTNLALAIRFPIGWAVKGNIFQHFCGGENIDECLVAAEKLSRSGIGSILDYSVEGRESEEDLDATCAEIIRTIQASAGKSHFPFCVFKVTGIIPFSILEKKSEGNLSGEELEIWNRGKKRVEKICEAAAQRHQRIFVDAEDSWIQNAIDELADEMMSKFNATQAIVYNTIQLYRHDRLAFLKDSHARAIAGNYILGVKLVRGAYMEKERERASSLGYTDPIQPDKASSDRDYDAAALYCLDHINKIHFCAGTHNERSSLMIAEEMIARGILPSDPRVSFAQLFGMSDHISFNLAASGFQVCKYMPYGPLRDVMPYLIRRARENTSVKGQAGRELSLIRTELKRRLEKRAIANN